MESMRNGSIRYISMQNWMAYTGPVVLRANPGVNIIAASNGSGKSAIVCAIALSLGFDPNILSRGDNIRSFVKRGCMNSVLKVGLADNKSKGGTIDIERRITLTEQNTNKELNPDSQRNSQTSKYHTSVKNEWFINGSRSDLDTVRSLYKRLNLQLDNLLTFLAQANVGKFSAMTQQELFRSTLNAINPEFVNQLDVLIELSQKLKAKISQCKSIEQALQSSNSKLAELRQVSDAMVKVKDASLYRNIVKLKLYQMKLGNITKGYETTRKRMADTNNDIYTRETKFKKLETRYNKMQTNTKNLIEDSKKKIEGANKILQEDYIYLNQNSTNDSSGNEPVERAFYDSIAIIKSFLSDFKRSQTRKDISEENQDNIKSKLESLEDEIKEIKSKMVLNNELVDQIAKCKFNEESLRYRLRKYKTQGKVNFDEVQFESLMNHLPYMKRDLISRYINHCKKHSIKPHKIIANEIKVQGNLNCAIVEESIGNYLDCILLSREDYDKNLKILKDFRLPIVTEPKNKNVLCKVSKNMKKFGVKNFVHELVEASEMTIQSLSSVCQINEIFVVDEQKYDQYFLDKKSKKDSEDKFSEFYNTMIAEITGQLGKKTNTLKYFIGNKKHLYKHFTESNYYLDSQVTISTKPRVLVDYSSYGKDSGRKDEESLENQLNEATKELFELNKKLKENDEKNKNLNRKLYALTRQQLSLEKSLKSIESEENRNLSNKQWKQKLEKMKEARIKEIRTSIVTSAKNLMSKLQKTSEMKNNLIEANETYNLYCSQMIDLENLTVMFNDLKKELDELKSSKKMLQNTLEEQKEKLDTYKNTISELKRIMKTSEELFDSAYFNEELTRNFAEIKKDFENKLINMTEGDLEKELIKAEEQVKQLENDDFEEIQLMKMIQEERNNKNKYKNDIAELNKEIGLLTSDRNEKYGEWEGRVKQIIKEIDDKFGKYMKYIGDGSDGQVRLEIEMDNIKEGKLRVLVKFDKEKDLLPLTTSYQSGGERGVTTMVYILSVQNLTNNPFFVIDEINQGLDSHYERKLMKLLLGSPGEGNNQVNQDLENEMEGNQANMPQYFILTPQLISGYDLSNATLHFPLNGPGIGKDLTI